MLWAEATDLLTQLHAAGNSYTRIRTDTAVITKLRVDYIDVDKLHAQECKRRLLKALPQISKESSLPLKCAFLACLAKCANICGDGVLQSPAAHGMVKAIQGSLVDPGAQALLAKLSQPTGGAAAVKGPVCVTGANGFLGAHLVLQLLESGYTVHGTVRSTGDESKTEHLLAMPGAAERLRLFECDLMGGKEAFTTAMQSCTGVYHTASPFFLKGYEDGQQALVQPAVQGTQAVLGAVLDSPSVTRVVLTSSTASVYIDKRPSDHVYDEDDWSDLEHVRERGMHYVESKILAERTAWGMLGPVMQEGARKLDLVVIAPTLIIGPMLQSSLNTSSAHLLALVDGSKAELPPGNKCFVDVRDTAAMHIKAMVDPSANGRYLCIAESVPYTAVAKVIRGALPPPLLQSMAAPAQAAPEPAAHIVWSKEKAYQLGQHFRPVEHSIADTVISLYLKGHMNSCLPEALQRRPPQGAAAAPGAAAE